MLFTLQPLLLAQNERMQLRVDSRLCILNEHLVLLARRRHAHIVEVRVMQLFCDAL